MIVLQNDFHTYFPCNEKKKKVFNIPVFQASSNAGIFQAESNDKGGNLDGGWVTSLATGWLEIVVGGTETN